MKQLTTSSLKQGYITIPRALLNRQATDGAAGETEAFLQILAHTNYSDVPYDINGTIILCKRGDSLISYHHWSNIFGWTRPKTTRFFQRLAKGGIIDLIPHQEKIYSISVSPTLIFGPDVSLRKPKTPERKKSPQTSTFSGTNTTP